MSKIWRKAAAVFVALLLAVSVLPYGVKAENATVFTFTDDGIEVSEGDYTGYKIEGTALTINDAGSYVVTGSCTDGSIKVKKGTTGVTLTLSDLTLSSSDTAALACNKSTEVDIVISGTVSLSDSAYNSEDYLVDNGYATYDESEDAYYYTSSYLDGSLSGEEVNAENAVIKLKANSVITISGTGTLNVTANAKNAVKQSADTDDTTNLPTEDTGSLTVSGITMNIDTTNAYDPGDGDTYGDGFNIGKSLTILSGTYNIAAGDDGIHSDYDLVIGTAGGSDSDLVINITECYEGIEGANLTVNSGTITVISDDDGLNAANSDFTDYQYNMTINGGYLYIDAGDDGLDSNGTLTINGGTVIAFSGSDQSASPFDTGTDGSTTIDDTFVINGGTVLGIGQGGMAIVPEESSQDYVTWGYGSMGMGNMGQAPGEMQEGPGAGEGTTPPEKPDGDTSGMGGGMTPPDQQGGGMPGGMMSSGSASNMDDTSALTLNDGIAAGSSVSLSGGDTVTVYNNGTALITATALRSANFVFYSGDFTTSTTVETKGVIGEKGSEGGMTPPDRGGERPGEQQTQVQIPAQSTDGDTVMMYRLYNPNSGEHFYTSDYNEAVELAKIGWNYEGVGWTAPTSGVAVYRLYNSNAGEHHYTTSEAERDALVALGWTDEGIGWYSLSADDENAVAVYREYNPNEYANNHNYTKDTNEHDTLISLGWKDEGIAWYAVNTEN